VCSGCVMAYNSGKTERSWVISIASKSNAGSIAMNQSTNGTGMKIERGATEAQPEAIKAVSEGVTKGATGNPFSLNSGNVPLIPAPGFSHIPNGPTLDTALVEISQTLEIGPNGY
jgi:hypothetical protein